METLSLKTSDETPQDGEQQAGIFFSYLTKQKLGHLISQTGVHELAKGINYDAIAAVTDYIDQLGFRPAPPLLSSISTP
jgi:isopropylmalate/homocitrate/citramalate synthase